MVLSEDEVKLYGDKGPRFGDEIPGSRELKVLPVDSLIGDSIEGTNYFETIEGDETEAGFFVVGTFKHYLTRHTPTGSHVTYRKVWADIKRSFKVSRERVWEVDSN